MRLQILFILLLLAGCAPKKSDPVPVEPIRSAPVLKGEPAPRNLGSEGLSTRVQVACETNTPGILLPNSKRVPGDRVRDFVKTTPGFRLAAPAILGMRDGVIRLFFFDGNAPVVTDYGFAEGKESGLRTELPVNEQGSSPIYEELGFDRPRLAASSPDRTVFVLASDRGFDLRSVANPTELKGSLALEGSFGNPRWEPGSRGSEIFVDRLGGKYMRQSMLELNGSHELESVRPLPRAVNGHQIGLRRLNEQTLIWLEWTKRRSIVRLWNTSTGKLEDLRVPSAKSPFGPGLALYQAPGEPKVVVLQSSVGIHFFGIRQSSLVASYQADYSPLVTDNIRRNIHGWKPGAVYSAAGDTQVFAVLPSTWGKLLYSLEEGQVFRQLGHEQCLNPDFYPEI